MPITLNIGIDLGGDTVKVAFAYKQGQQLRYGKLMKSGILTQVALPAVAYYDEDTNAWFYADEVDRKVERSFVNVVKIKSLLSMLLKQADDKAQTSNRAFYSSGFEFPKFYFPVRRKMNTDFGKMVNDGMTFCARSTPQTVCEGFFAYLHAVVLERVSALAEAHGVEFAEEWKIALVHPSQTGKEYVAELERLVTLAFGVAPYKKLSSTKALCLYAGERGMFKKGESVLAFDLGEQDISVTKAMLLQNGRLVVEGADGHNAPIDLGGNDIDDAIATYIEGSILRRETMGTPPFGEEGHIQERGLHSKQYLFLKDIKKAKMILSMPLKADSVFSSGVPIGLCRDLYIQRKLTKNEFCKCVGVDRNDGIAQKIANYLISELKRPGNRDVKKVFLSGGLLETYGLLEYLTAQVKQASARMQVFTFDDNEKVDDGFKILSFEDSTYAPSVGGAIVALRDLNVASVVGVSYGTWVGSDGKRIVEIFLNKGTELPEQPKFFPTYAHFNPTDEISDEEIYLLSVTQEEIQTRMHYPPSMRPVEAGYFHYNGKYTVVIGRERNSPQRRAAEKYVGLTSVGGAGEKKITFYYKGDKVRLLKQIPFAEGVILDSEGIAEPYIKMEKEGDTPMENSSMRRTSVQSIKTGEIYHIFESEIEIRMPGMPTKIKSQAND